MDNLISFSVIFMNPFILSVNQDDENKECPEKISLLVYFGVLWSPKNA